MFCQASHPGVSSLDVQKWAPPDLPGDAHDLRLVWQYFRLLKSPYPVEIQDRLNVGDPSSKWLENSRRLAEKNRNAITWGLGLTLI